MRPKKILVLLTIFLSAFFLFHPQPSLGFYCKCSGPLEKDNFCSSLGQLSAAIKTCNQLEDFVNSDSGRHVTCEQFKDEQCTFSETPRSPVDNLQSDLSSKKPALEINIPEINFSDVASTTENGDIYFFIPWIPELISGLYKFLLAIVSIVAAVVIVVQGLRVITSGGGEAKQAAYKRILQSIIGLFIAWGSFAILYNINPALVQFNALKVKIVERDELPDLEIMQTTEADTGNPSEYEETSVGNHAPAFTNCPITLNSPYNSSPTSDRAKEFFEKIDSAITGTTAADRVVQIADAALACNVSFGSCGRTAGNIYTLAGVVTGDAPDKSCLYGQGPGKHKTCETYFAHQVFSVPKEFIKSVSKYQCIKEDKQNAGLANQPGCSNERSAAIALAKKDLSTIMSRIDKGWPNVWANQLEPGDAMWTYNGNTGNGVHTTIFVGWKDKNKGIAQTIDGSSGKPTHPGAPCIKTICGEKMIPILKIFKAKY